MIKDFKVSEIDLSGKRVRFRGVCEDKCGLSSVIHHVAFLAGNSVWPLWSDIYWDSFKYSDLKEELIRWIDKYNNK